MTKLLRSRYIWLIATLLGVAALLAYPVEHYILSGLPPDLGRRGVHMILLVLRSGLLLIAVSIAAWRFKVGGAGYWSVIGLLLLPHIIDEMASPSHLGQSMFALYSIGVVVGLAFSLIIGRHKQSEDTLRESEAKYKGLVTNVKLGIFRSTQGRSGRFLEVNPAMEEITGYSREELLQMKVPDLYVRQEGRGAVLGKVASATGG